MYRYERRDEKLEAKRKREKKHGKSIGILYRNAIEKRVNKKRIRKTDTEV